MEHDQERVMGFEPTTHGLGSRSSTAELHPQTVADYSPYA